MGSGGSANQQNKRAEVWMVDHSGWLETGNYPFVMGYTNVTYQYSTRFLFNPWVAKNAFIFLAPIISLDNAFYVFGGRDNNASIKIIGRLDAVTKEWTQAGELQKNRERHSVIFDNQDVIVVGGVGEQNTERCSLQNGTFSCTEQTPVLLNYRDYPELVLVEDGFCKEWPWKTSTATFKNNYFI